MSKIIKLNQEFNAYETVNRSSRDKLTLVESKLLDDTLMIGDDNLK